MSKEVKMIKEKIRDYSALELCVEMNQILELAKLDAKAVTIQQAHLILAIQDELDRRIGNCAPLLREKKALEEKEERALNEKEERDEIRKDAAVITFRIEARNSLGTLVKALTLRAESKKAALKKAKDTLKELQHLEFKVT